MEDTTKEIMEVAEELNQEEEETQTISLVIVSPAKEEIKLLVRDRVFSIRCFAIHALLCLV